MTFRLLETIDCQHYSQGNCRYPHAPQPLIAKWPRCILDKGDCRVACCVRWPHHQVMPATVEVAA